MLTVQTSVQPSKKTEICIFKNWHPTQTSNKSRSPHSSQPRMLLPSKKLQSITWQSASIPRTPWASRGQSKINLCFNRRSIWWTVIASSRTNHVTTPLSRTHRSWNSMLTRSFRNFLGNSWKELRTRTPLIYLNLGETSVLKSSRRIRNIRKK